MDPATLARHALEAPKRPLTLKEALSSVADFRIDRRKKFPLYEILMIAVCAMIDGAKGPAFGVASLRSVSAAVSPDERSEESPKAMSIRGASSNSASSGKRTGALSPLVAGYWLLVVGTLRPQAVPTSAWSSPSCTTRAPGKRQAMLRHVVINVLRLDKSVFGGISVKRKELTWDDEKLLGLMLAA